MRHIEGLFASTIASDRLYDAITVARRKTSATPLSQRADVLSRVQSIDSGLWLSRMGARDGSSVAAEPECEDASCERVDWLW